MGEGNNETNGQTDERIIVTVTDVGEEDRGQASMIDDRMRAERIVKSLIDHGIEPEAVSALKAKEVPLDVTYRWEVQLVEANAARTPALRSIRQVMGAIGATIKFLHDLAPARPFEMRLDRLVWVALWLGSLFLLGVSVVASMSSGAAREVIVELPAQYQELQSGEPAVSPVLTPPVTASPFATASPFSRGSANERPTPAVGSAAREPDCAGGGINDCTCSDFDTQPVAQAFYESHRPGPGQIVDPDGNGRFCEWLPKG